MRKVTFGVGSSLDNFIAGKDHETDWLIWSDEVAALTARFWKTIDTVLMERKTYEVAAKSGNPAYPGVKNYVLSRTLRQRPHAQVELISEAAAPFVRRLKARPGEGICVMGGGELAAALLEADLIDEIGLNVHPVLLGSGIPLFHPMSRPTHLVLLECQPIAHDCVFVRYQVDH